MKNIITLFLVLSASIMMAANIPTEGGLQVGDKAPDFSLKNLDGSFVSLSDYKDAKGYIVIFTCNTCPYAVMYEDRIKELHSKYARMGYPVIAINPNDPSVKEGDSPADMKVRAQEKGFEFPYLFDAGQTVFPQYGATKTPHVYLLDSNKIVKYIGAIDDNPQDAKGADVKYVEAAIDALSKGQNPNPSMTKAIGCSIKVKA